MYTIYSDGDDHHKDKHSQRIRKLIMPNVLVIHTSGV